MGGHAAKRVAAEHRELVIPASIDSAGIARPFPVRPSPRIRREAEPPDFASGAGDQDRRRHLMKVKEFAAVITSLAASTAFWSRINRAGAS